MDDIFNRAKYITDWAYNMATDDWDSEIAGRHKFDKVQEEEWINARALTYVNAVKAVTSG